MSVQPSLNNSNMVVAEIINEINSTQPTRNYPQNARATPIQPSQQMQRPSQQMQRPSQPQYQQQQQQRQSQQQQRQPQQQQQPQQSSQKRATPCRRPTTQQPRMSKPIPTPPQRAQKKSSFLQKQKEKLRNKKVRFKEEVEEHVIQEHNSERESENESESESDSDDSNALEEVIHKSKKKVLAKPKFLEKDKVKSSDLTETQGFYTKAITDLTGTGGFKSIQIFKIRTFDKLIRSCFNLILFSTLIYI